MPERMGLSLSPCQCHFRPLLRWGLGFTPHPALGLRPLHVCNTQSNLGFARRIANSKGLPLGAGRARISVASRTFPVNHRAYISVRPPIAISAAALLSTALPVTGKIVAKPAMVSRRAEATAMELGVVMNDVLTLTVERLGAIIMSVASIRPREGM